MLVAIYLRGLKIIEFNGSTISFTKHIHNCIFEEEHTFVIAGFLRDCANYTQGVLATELKSIKL